MIPKRFEQQALELVIEAATHGALWTTISPDTLEIIIRAVALDLERAARIAEAQAELGASTRSSDSHPHQDD